MSVLRPACLSDVPFEWITRPAYIHRGYGLKYNAAQHGALQALYDAEWQKRGYRRSP